MVINLCVFPFVSLCQLNVFAYYALIIVSPSCIQQTVCSISTTLKSCPIIAPAFLIVFLTAVGSQGRTIDQF